MIPTLILCGVVFGRWWRVTLLASALAWPLLLVVTGVTGFGPGLVGAAVLAVVNTGVGVLVHQAALWLFRGLRRAATARRGA